MPPLTDRQRETLTALGLLERRLSDSQAAAELRSRYGWLSDAEAADRVHQARAIQARAVGASLASGEDTVASVAGPLAPAGTSYLAEATVTVDAPGRDREYRTVRISVTGEETTSEVNARFDAVVDEMAERYDVDGVAYSWSLRYIL